MQVKLLIDWTGPAVGDGISRQHPAGSVIRVSLHPGIKLLRRRQAKWISGDSEDQGFIPVEPFRMQVPQHDKMIRSAVNK